MVLTIDAIRSVADDGELVRRLSDELERRFPSDLQANLDRFVTALRAAPRGLRAMAAVHPLDVSMTLDDLAWHFGNHNDDRLLHETLVGLRELGAMEAADIFLAAWEIVKPFLPEIRSTNWDENDPADYLDRTGVQSKIDSLNTRLNRVCEAGGDLGLMQYWAAYARQYPERCVAD